MTRNYRYKSTPSIHDSRLGPYDILCGRSRNAYNNVGNRRFRVSIRMFLLRYQHLKSRADRKIFIFYLTKLFREEIGFRFLKKEAGDFHDIGEVETRKKIGHALLDQTVKHPLDNVAATTPTPADSSCSPTVLVRKVTDVKKKKKPLRSILKKSSSSSPSRPIQSQQSEDQKFRRVSLSEGDESSSSSHFNNKSSRGQGGVSKKKKAKITKLESEICMFLVGMQKQNNDVPAVANQQQQQQQCAA
mmetsp:Transcript_39454/g.95452  ORF Transcript_39454/g.95452 Transcript_39454/m.95452 type:complete len:245 (+) Transcript_39454:132-866(+)|eukprot:CAMPEP_0113620022 /NCGR_PEP_ID=MMETSP0017_2-20120614/10188_1 /TAXON_ID=2856 /ORGANISM="Cylindrotheca closterium" /LENGTH=244 /DNA_ID=CAMNT_0000529649 /DNA_START=132 /DNA_END=866 /DNA_ORIENTATION=+ /assembly_acc=CAM_ASM_000147